VGTERLEPVDPGPEHRSVASAPFEWLQDLEPEETLHLGPHREAENDEEEDEQRERGCEPQARELRRTATLDLKAPLRAMESIRPLNRFARVDGRVGGRRLVCLEIWFGPSHVAEV
jgi:hypothetical protein